MPDESSRPFGPAIREVAVRSARPADLDDLVRLEERAFAGDRIARRRMRAFSAGSHTARIVVADDGGRLVGYALVLLRRTSRVARLYSLAVDPDASGRGIGRALLQAAERAAERAGAETLRLEVRTDNARAIRLYEASGYTPIGTRDAYYADGQPALRYERRLGSRGGALPGLNSPALAAAHS